MACGLRRQEGRRKKRWPRGVRGQCAFRRKLRRKTGDTVPRGPPRRQACRERATCANRASAPAISRDGESSGGSQAWTLLFWARRRRIRSDHPRMQRAAQSMPRGELLCEPRRPTRRASRLRPKHWRAGHDGASVCAREGVAIYAWVTLSKLAVPRFAGGCTAWFDCRKSGGSLCQPSQRCAGLTPRLRCNGHSQKKSPCPSSKGGSSCARRPFRASRACRTVSGRRS
jgi:hypothetical protein